MSEDVPSLTVSVFMRDEVTRLGLAAILSSLPMVSAVEYCATWADASRVVYTGSADILMLSDSDSDLQLWAEPGSPTKILVLVRDHQRIDEVLAANLSPDGFLVQGEITADTLPDVLRRVWCGEVPMPATVARALMDRVGVAVPPPRRGRVALTPRESETLELLGEGLSNKQIARRLRISSHGAKRIVASLLLKLDSPNRTMAVVTAIQNGLIKTR